MDERDVTNYLCGINNTWQKCISNNVFTKIDFRLNTYGTNVKVTLHIKTVARTALTVRIITCFAFTLFLINTKAFTYSRSETKEKRIIMT